MVFRREAGEIQARKKDQPLRSKPDAHDVFILGLSEEAPAEQKRPNMLRHSRAWFAGQLDLDPEKLILTRPRSRLR